MKNTERILKEKQVRPTAMRLLVYEFMEAKKVAVTLTGIEKAFVKSDRTTLYRTIKTFEENSIVHRIEDGTGITKYALCEKKTVIVKLIPTCTCIFTVTPVIKHSV